MERELLNIKPATLFLLPSSIAAGTVDKAIPPYNIGIMSKLRFFIVENERTARRFLREAKIKTDFAEIEFLLLNKHTRRDEYHLLLNPCRLGNDTGILSESGMPAIADPGAEVVMMARDEGINVSVLSGPSSVLLALAGSGLNGQCFAFNGYLPIEKKTLIKKLKDLENKAISENQTQIFIETPYRNQRLFETIISCCRPDTMLSIATEITAQNYKQETLRINDWKIAQASLNKLNSVFLIGKKY